jgi:hypothetical protein
MERPKPGDERCLHAIWGRETRCVFVHCEGFSNDDHTEIHSCWTVCIGVHLVQMELALAAVRFFQEFRNARLAPETTPDSMEFENYFLVAPKSHRCNIIL